MNLWSILIITLGSGFMLLAHWWFVMNTRFQHYDTMGASISFDQPFAIGAILISIGIGLAGWLPWYFCILLFVALEAISLPYKWKLLDPIAGRFRKPNPTKNNSEQAGRGNALPRAPHP